MERDDYNHLCNVLHERRMDLAKSKGSDYAGYDVLSNFKRLSRVADILHVDIRKPEGYAMFMALMKIDRILNLTNSGRAPNNESVDDSFMDLHNYIDLTRAILHEKAESISSMGD